MDTTLEGRRNELPDTINVDGLIDRRFDTIEYIGIAVKVDNIHYKCLAKVNGMLGIMLIRIHQLAEAKDAKS